MTRLLILCEYFPPENKIGAVRPARLAKYLAKQQGIEVSVVCAKPHGLACAKEDQMYDSVRVRRISKGKLVGLLHRKSPNGSGGMNGKVPVGKERISVRLKRRLVSGILSVRDRMERETLYRGAIRNIAMDEYDVIFSTFNTDFGHRVAKWYKTRHPSVKWIADFRDPTWSVAMTEERKAAAKEFAADVARCCDVITVVTPGIVDAHREDFLDRRCCVVYNGYDPDDRIGMEQADNDGVFRLVYTGELYNGRRDLRPVFCALTRLAEQEKVDLSKIEVVYAGQSGSVFEEQAARFGAIRYCNKGFVAHPTAMNLQNQAQILLLASWCGHNDKYTLTGKFFEYLSANRPIVCVISGEEKGSALSTAINEHGLGVCYEAANDQIDFERLCAYLEAQYCGFIMKQSGAFKPDLEYIGQFSYEKIAEQVYDIISE